MFVENRLYIITQLFLVLGLRHTAFFLLLIQTVLFPTVFFSILPYCVYLSVEFEQLGGTYYFIMKNCWRKKQYGDTQINNKLSIWTVRRWACYNTAFSSYQDWVSKNDKTIMYGIHSNVAVIGYIKPFRLTPIKTAV